MKTIIEDCKRVEIENNGKKLSKTITIIREDGTFIKIEISNARLKGEWHHSGECSICHKRSLRTTPLGDIIGIDFSDFCKNCGADMRQEATNDK